MPEITKGPVHLFYEDAGAGPAVLFSHSWFCDGRQWPQTETLISAGYRTLNLDNRGHGRSGQYRDHFSLWDMADDLVAVLDAAGVDEAVLVGLSIGGFAALRAALKHPDRTQALVLADTDAGAARWQDRVKASVLGPVWLTPVRPLLLPVLEGTSSARLLVVSSPIWWPNGTADSWSRIRGPCGRPSEPSLPVTTSVRGSARSRSQRW
jgi:pimeloyl-ACP methyl ester carboxylesterase